MEEINTKDARKLYGRILDEVENLDDVVGSFPLCICRGRCVCHVTTEQKKLYIDEIRKDYEEKEANYKYKKVA